MLVSDVLDSCYIVKTNEWNKGASCIEEEEYPYPV